MAEKKLSKKALNKSFRNWFYGHLTCFSQEHMQTFGYLCAMLPLVEELYDTKEEHKIMRNIADKFFIFFIHKNFLFCRFLQPDRKSVV